MSAAKVLDVLRRHGLTLRRSLGQNFLVDDNILAKIIEAAELSSSDTVLEVGAGIGVLTEALAASGAQVVAVELDRRFLPALRDTVSAWPNVTVISKDAMELTGEELTSPLVVRKTVSNLPYNIAAPLLMRLAQRAPGIEKYVVMVQKEIAERICSGPGRKTYGAYTVKLSYYLQARLLFDVSRNSFLPRPNVDSAVVLLSKRERPPVGGDARAIFDLVNTTFAQRRKMILTSLSELFQGKMDKGEVEELIREAGLDPRARPENLELKDFAALATALER